MTRSDKPRESIESNNKINHFLLSETCDLVGPRARSDSPHRLGSKSLVLEDDSLDSVGFWPGQESSTSDKMICQDLRMDFRVSSGSGRRYS